VTLTARQWMILAAAGSAVLMLGALAFQHLGGLYPCILCLWQRWPHLVALLLGLAVLKWQGPALPALAGLAVLTSAGIGVYHFGVEQDWWAGLQQCAHLGAHVAPRKNAAGTQRSHPA
jgi:disulfide bond formation protein DsbB